MTSRVRQNLLLLISSDSPFFVRFLVGAVVWGLPSLLVEGLTWDEAFGGLG